MNAISRRTALSSGGLTVAAYLASAQLPSFAEAHAQSTGTPNLSTGGSLGTLIQLNSYALSHVGNAGAKLRAGNANASDLRQASGAVRLYAAELQRLGADKHSKRIADKLDPGIDPVGTSSFEKVFSTLKSYDASWTRAELADFCRSQDVSEIKKSIVTNGISWQYSVAAEVFRVFSAYLPESEGSSASKTTISAEIHMPPGRTMDAVYRRAPEIARFDADRSHVGDLVYHLSEKPRLSQISFGSFCHTYFCKYLSSAVGYGTTRLITLTTGWTPAQFCQADLVVSVLSDVLTEDLATIATPFETAVCTAAVTIGVSAAIATAFSTVQSHFGC